MTLIGTIRSIRSGRFGRITNDARWAATGQFFNGVALLVSVRVLTELLPPEEFGRLSLLLTISALALGLSATPRLQALIRFYPEFLQSRQTAQLRTAGGMIVARAVSVASIVIACGWLALFSFIDEGWSTGLLIIALLVVDSIRSFELALFSAARRQRDAALIYAADAWSRPFIAFVAIVVSDGGAVAALFGYVAASSIIVVLIQTRMSMEGRCPLDAVADKLGREKAPNSITSKLSKAVHRYALPLAPLALLEWISTIGDRYVITAILGLHDAGIYVAAYAIASRPFIILLSAIEMVLRPILQTAIAERDQAQIKSLKTAWVMTMFAVSVAGVLAFASLNEVAAQLLLASEFSEAAMYMPVIAMAYGLFAIASVFLRFCYAFDATRSVLLVSAVGAIVSLGLMIPLTQQFGIMGAAVALASGFALRLIASIFFAAFAERRYWENRPENDQIWK